MKDMVRLRVYERRESEYVLAGKDIPLETSIRQQMEAGYFPMDFISFGVDMLRVVFNYAPAQVARFKDHSEVNLDLVNMKTEDGV